MTFSTFRQAGNEETRKASSTCILVVATIICIIFGWMLSVAKKQRSEIVELETAIQTVLDVTEKGFMRIDENQIIVFVNDTLLSITGYTRQELIGTSLSVLVSPEDWAGHTMAYGEAFETRAKELPPGEPLEVLLKCNLLTKNKISLPVFVNAYVLPDRTGMAFITPKEKLSLKIEPEDVLDELQASELLDAQRSEEIRKDIAGLRKVVEDLSKQADN